VPCRSVDFQVLDSLRGNREKILNAKFDGYLSKPVNSQSLAEELDRLLNKGTDQGISRAFGFEQHA
jgi:CheY-like chemotaxis protein